MRLDRPGTRVCHHSAVVEDDPAQDERKALEAFVVENEGHRYDELFEDQL
jgi:hypothetical protein